MVKIRQDVLVGVGRDGRRAVAQPVSQNSWRDSGSQTWHAGGEGRAGGCGGATGSDRFGEPARHPFGMERPAVAMSEDQIQILIVAPQAKAVTELATSVFAENPDEIRIESDQAPTARSLRLAEHDPMIDGNKAPPYGGRLGLQIDVRPAQGQRLTSTHAG